MSKHKVFVMDPQKTINVFGLRQIVFFISAALQEVDTVERYQRIRCVVSVYFVPSSYMLWL
jgi:hypothetical protein